MSLYVEGEVCSSCPNALMHSCGNCLRRCRKDFTPYLINGVCLGYEGKDEAVLDRIAKWAKGGYGGVPIEPGKGPKGKEIIPPKPGDLFKKDTP